ncbi:MAG: hypothetical protein ACREP7_15770 [Lysobacter sp.]
MLALALIGALLGAAPVQAQVYQKDNGVLRVRLNESGYPMITSMWLLNSLVVPHDNAGADFQMTLRSSRGNAYNPTQGGDCKGNASKLTGVQPNWANNLGLPAANGILLGVTPRDYGEPEGTYCAGNGALLPFEMNFGVTLGDGARIPKEAMILDLSSKRLQGAEEIVPEMSDMPSIFINNNIYRYAYYSTDGRTFTAFDQGVATHDSIAWPLATNYYLHARTLVLCNVPNAISDPRAGACVGLYSHDAVLAYASNRRGARNNLTLLSLLSQAPPVTDYNWHTVRKAFISGNLETVTAVSTSLDASISDWGGW